MNWFNEILIWIGEVYNIIIGSTYSSAEYTAFMFFTLVGMLAVKFRSWILKVKRHRQDPANVPLVFSRKHWINDNLLDFSSAYLSSFITLRFLGFALVKIPLPEGVDFLFYGLLLGLFFQKIWHYILNDITITDTLQKIKVKK